MPQNRTDPSLGADSGTEGGGSRRCLKRRRRSDDFTFEDFGMMMCGITSTMYYKPGSADWRRHLAIILHGVRAPVRDVEPQSA
jgi:hypothetical protein